MSDQLELFKEYITKIKSAGGEEKASTIISEGIYIVCCGSNDVANTYFDTPIRRTHNDINSYSDFTASYASKFLQVYKHTSHGTLKGLLFNIPSY